ncbi:MAG: TonB-dependent receptor [Flavobacteriales bacterium]|nr:TonB-dependent receptor [Flavobacteriales bacterium]
MLFWRNITLFILAIVTHTGYAQTGVVHGTVTDEKGKALEQTSIIIIGTTKGTASTSNGAYSLKISANDSIGIAFSILGMETVKRTVFVKENEQLELNISMKAISIELDPNFEVIAERQRTTPMNRIEIKYIDALPTASGNFEGILFSEASVSSNNELSSQYSVRGGSFDENLIYVNDIQIFRPFLIRSGQQEGLSFINSDLVETVAFSAGGFEARFGDKMSSVLDITYKKPKEFAGSISGSLLGGAIHIEDGSKNHRFTQIHGIRYKTNKYVLNSLDVGGAYNPTFIDYQTYFTYDVTTDLEISFLGNIAQNKYSFVPETRQTDFGTINGGLRLTVFFDGQEVDAFTTYLGAFSAHYRPRHNLSLKLISSVFRSQEEETFDILGQYWLDELNRDLSSEDFGDVAFNRGVGSFLDHGRNELNALIYNIEHKGKYYEDNYTLLWGLKFQQERVDDKLSEWTMIDSAGYSIPQQPRNEVQLSEVYKADTSIVSERVMGYLQTNKEWELSDNSMAYLTAGSRFNYWTFNEQMVFSPRITLSWKPNWMQKKDSTKNKDFVFKAAWGFYHQPAFYREMRDLNGHINSDIKAQQSIHYVLGSDYQFTAWGDRQFKLTNEVYYKQLDNLIPYEIDNVRIRYYATNNSRGYAMGFETKIHGQFVKDIDSWASVGIMKIEEDIQDDFYIEYQDANGNKITPNIGGTANITDTVRYEPGYIPRPTDQRVNFGLFFQDYIPNHPNYKMHLNLLYGSGLPTGPPSFERYKDTLRIPPYRRVDIGFSFLLFSEKKKLQPNSPLKVFKSIWLSAEVFNLLQINNTISYLWIKDVTGRQYAVPNYLTSRRLNVKLVAKF